MPRLASHCMAVQSTAMLLGIAREAQLSCSLPEKKRPRFLLCSEKARKSLPERVECALTTGFRICGSLLFRFLLSCELDRPLRTACPLFVFPLLATYLHSLHFPFEQSAEGGHDVCGAPIKCEWDKARKPIARPSPPAPSHSFSAVMVWS